MCAVFTSETSTYANSYTTYWILSLQLFRFNTVTVAGEEG